MINFRGFLGTLLDFPHPENVKPIGNSPSKTITRIILANVLKTNFQRFFSRCYTAGQLEFDVGHNTSQKGTNLPREHGFFSVHPAVPIPRK